MPVSLEAVQSALWDKYDVQRRLGRGAMATVFLGVCLADGKRVAVKVLNPSFRMPTGAARFHREIRFLQTLHHPNILPLLASDEAGRFLYYVMPFADGGSLIPRISDQGYLSLLETADIVRQVAAALDYSHANNIVHRDIKPGNVLFHEGRARLCDFGIARAIIHSGGESLSSTGIIIGTPPYMSPEQARGDSDLDGRSDIYSLACVVCEMLIGEPPFTGRSAQAIMSKQIRLSPPSLRVVRPDLPQHVEDAVHWALAKERGDRPQSASELAAALV